MSLSLWKSLPFGLLSAAALLVPSDCVYSKPTGPTLKKGEAVITLGAGGEAMLIQAGKSALIDWQEFSIAREEILRIIHAGGSGCLVNRVTGTEKSELLGKLLSNGSVYLINPNGILIGKDAYIDTAGFIASTLDLLNEDLSEKTLHFQGDSEAEVINEGTIHCKVGDVFLIGRKVENAGEIVTENGRQGFLSGFDVVVRPNDAPKVQIRSEQVLEREEFAKNPYALAIRHSGKSLTGEKQGVYVSAANGKCEVSGEIVSPEGTVHVLGDVVHFTDEAVIDVSGENGGDVRMGGDYQGSGDLKRAKRVRLEKEGRISANALVKGDGGKVILWSDGLTEFFGEIEAEGGKEGGDGGFVEVSGKGLSYHGGVSTVAPCGKGGTLLLDPWNLAIAATTINAGSTGCFSNVDIWSTNDANSTIGTVDLVNSLISCASVFVNTTGSGNDAGNITIQESFSWSSGNALTLNASNSIIFATNTVVSGNGPLTLNAAGGTNTAGDGITVYNGAIISSSNSIAFNAHAGGTGNGITIYDGAQIMASNNIVMIASATAGHGIQMIGSIYIEGFDEIGLQGIAGGSGAGVILYNASTVGGQVLLTGSFQGAVNITDCQGAGAFPGVYIGGSVSILAGVVGVDFFACEGGSGANTCQGVRIANDYSDTGASNITLLVGASSIEFDTISGGNGGDSTGIYIGATNFVMSATNSGCFINMTNITGTSTTGTCYGLNMTAGQIQAASMTIQASAFTAVANSSPNAGINFAGGTIVMTGPLILNGVYSGSPAGTGGCSGVVIGGSLTSTAGSIQIQGSTNGMGTGSYGVLVSGTQNVATSGTTTIIGTSSNYIGYGQTASASFAGTLSISGLSSDNTGISISSFLGVTGSSAMSLLGTATINNTTTLTPPLAGILVTGTLGLGSGSMSIIGTIGGTNSPNGRVSGVDLVHITSTGSGSMTITGNNGVVGTASFYSGVFISSTGWNTGGGTLTFLNCSVGNATATQQSAGVSFGVSLPATLAGPVSFQNCTGAPMGTTFGVFLSGGTVSCGTVTFASVTIPNGPTNSSAVCFSGGTFIISGSLIGTQNITTGTGSTNNGWLGAAAISVSGNVDIAASSGSTSGNGNGISITSPLAVTGGSMLLLGSCTGTSSGSCIGVNLTLSGALSSVGTITISGTSNSTGGNSYGVQITAPQTAMGAPVQFINCEGGPGSASHGVYLNALLSTTGSVLFNNCTAGNNSGAFGVDIAGTLNATGNLIFATITTGSATLGGAAINVISTISIGGALIATQGITTGAGTNNAGWQSSASITAASIDILASSGSTIGSAYGISITGGTLTTTAGSLILQGISGTTGSVSYGINLGGGTFSVTGGSLVLGGTSNATATLSHGIAITTPFFTASPILFTQSQGGPGSGSAGVSIGATFNASNNVTFATITTAGTNGAGVSVSATMTISGALIATQGITTGTGSGNTGWLSSSSITAASIDILATSGATTGSAYGISLTGGTLTTTAGSLILQGVSGTTSTASYGIDLGGATFSITGGGLQLSGTSNSSANFSFGVAITAPFSINVPVLFTNSSGGTGGSCSAIYIGSTFITTNSSGVTFATLTTAAGAINSAPVWIDTTGSMNISGALIATESIVAAAGAGNLGFLSSGFIQAASINIMASSLATTGAAYGISITGGTLTTTAGSLILQGISGASSAVSYGINLGGTFSITGGSLQLSGTSNSSANLSHGVAITAPFSINVPVLFSNSSGGTGGSCSAIYIGTTFTTTSSSGITFATLTTAAGAVNSAPVWIGALGSMNISGALVATESIIAANGTSNVGFLIQGFVQAASINIQASSAATTGTAHGISITGGTVNTTTGSLILQGISGSSTTSSYGINLAAVNCISSTSGGNVLLSGTSSANAVNTFGVAVMSSLGTITTGMLTFQNCSGGSGSGTSAGVYIGAATATGGSLNFLSCTSGNGASSAGVDISAAVTAVGTTTFASITAGTDSSSSASDIFVGAPLTVTAGPLIATQNITGGPGPCSGWLTFSTTVSATSIDIATTISSTTGAGSYATNIQGTMTATNGSIVLIGNSTGAIASPSYGVYVNAHLSCTNGSIFLSGTSSATGGNSPGVLINVAQTLACPITFQNCQGGPGSASHGVSIAAAVTTSGSVTFASCTAGNGSGCFGVNIGSESPLTASGNITFANITTGASTTSGGAVEVIGNINGSGTLIATQNITTGSGTNNTGWLSSASMTATMIDILATSGSNGATRGTAYGISLTGGTLKTTAGSLVLQGISGTTGSVSYGINLGSGTFSVTGGSLVLGGTSNSTASLSHGIAITAPFFTASPILFTQCQGGTGSGSAGVSIGATFTASNNVTFATITTAGTMGAGVLVSATMTITTGALIATQGITTGTGIGNTGWQSSASISANSIDILATSGSTTGSAYGISITGGTLTTNAGSLILQGISGTTSTASYGINLGRATFSITGGSLQLSGTSNASANFSHGVAITAPFSINVPVLFSNSSGGTGGSCSAIYIGSTFTTTSSSGVTFATLTTAAGAINSAPVWIDTTGSMNISGALIATESIVAAAGSGNLGFLSSGFIQAASINIMASSLATTGAAYGISITGGTLTTTAGSLILQGISGASSAVSYGINLGGTFSITGGSLQLSGTSNASANFSHGVAITAPFSINVPVLFSNSSGGTGGSCSAIYIGSTFITTNSSGVTFASLTTAAGAVNSAPVWIDTTGSMNVSGALIATQSIVAAAGAGNLGFLSSGFIQAASINIMASSLATTGAAYGISITGGTLSATMIELSGTGGASSGSSHGVNIAGGTITTSTGSITISGAASGAATSYGFNLSSGSVQSSSGSITITGTSTATGTGSSGVSSSGLWNALTTGTVTFNGSISASGLFPIQVGATFSTGGVLLYNDAVGIGGTITSVGITSNGTMTFASTIDGFAANADSLTLSASNTAPILFDGNIGATTALASLIVGTATSAQFGSSVGTVNATTMNFAVPVTYATTGTLNMTGTSSITFGSTLDAPGTGNLQVSGTTTFNGNIGLTNPLGILTVLTGASFGTQTATVNVAALNLISPAPATFAAVTTTVTASNSITFGGDLNAAANNVTTLNLNAATGSVTFGGNIGNNDIFAALNINDASAVVFTTGTHTANVNNWVIGSSSMLIPTVLEGTDSTTINSSGVITFDGTIDGSQTLNLNATSTVTLGGNIGVTTPLNTLAIIGGSELLFGTSVAMVTVGTLNISGTIPTVFSAATTTVTTTGSGGITFNGSLNGEAANVTTLNLSAVGSVTFGSDIGTTEMFAGFNINNASAVVFTSGTHTVDVHSWDVGTITTLIPTVLQGTNSTTINSGGSITFYGTIDGSQTLTLNATTTVALNSNIGVTTPLAALIVGTATSSAFGSSVGTVTATVVDIASPATYATTGTLNITGSTTFASTLDAPGTGNLQLSGTVAFGGNIGSTNPLGILTVLTAASFGASTATVNVAALNIVAPAPATFAATTANVNASNSITFGGDLNAAANNVTTLNLNAATGSVTFGGNIGNNNIFAALNINEASTVVFTAATHTVNVNTWDIGTISGSIPTLLEGAGTTTINSGGAITFYGTIDGSQTLTLNATSTVSLNSNIGETTPLAALIVGTATSTALGSSVGTVTATVVDIASPATYATTGTLNITGSTTFGGALDAPGAGNLQLSGTVAFGGNIGSTNPLGTLTVLTGANFGASVATVNVAALNLMAPAPATFAAVTTTVSASNSITFGGNLNPAVNNVTTLNLNAATGSVTFGGDIGNNDIFAALNINEASTVVFTTGTHTANVNNWIIGSSSMLIPTVLQGTDSTTINSSGVITFDGTIDGSQTLNLNATSTVTLGGDIGFTTPLNTLAIIGGSQLLFGTSVATVTVGTLNISGTIPTVFSAATTTVTTTGSGGITFNGSLNGEAANVTTLNLSAVGSVTFGSDIGTTEMFAGFNINAASAVVFTAGTHTVDVHSWDIGTITTLIPTVLQGTDSTTINSGGSITFYGTIDGSQTLNLNATDTVTLNSNVGVTTPLAALNIPVGSQTIFGTMAGTVNASVVNIAIPAAFATSTIVTGTNGITFGNTVDGSANLTLNAASGTLSFAANVTTLGETTINAGTASFGASVATVNVSGLNVQGTTHSFFAAATTTVTGSSGDVTFSGDIDGTANGVTTLNLLSPNGSVTIGGNVGVLFRLKALDINATTSMINAGSTTVFTSGTHSVNVGAFNSASPVVAEGAGSTTINTDFSSGPITFGDTINGDGGGSYTIVLNAGTGGLGTITLNGNVGDTNPLGTFSVVSADLTTMASTVATISAGEISLASPVTYATTGTLNITGSTTFGSTLDAPGTGNLQLSGTVVFDGNVGSTNPLGILTILTAANFGTQTATVNVAALNLVAPAPATFAATTTTVSASNSITFGGDLNAATNNVTTLDLNAATGSVTFGGNIGNNDIFAALNINEASVVVFTTGTHTANVNNWVIGSSSMLIPTVLQGTDSTTINSSGVITFDGTIDGSQTLNLNATSTVTLGGDIGVTTPLNTLAIIAGSELLFGTSVATVTVGTLNISGTIPTVFAATMTTVTTTGSGGITFNGSLNGEAANVTTLNLSAVGSVTFGSDIGTTEMFAGFNINNASAVVFTAGTHTVDVHSWDIGTITTLIPTLLQGAGTTTINSGGSITFYGTIDGSQTLTLNATDTVSLNGNIGATTALTALDIPEGSLTTFGTLTATVTATVVDIATPVTYATTGTLNITGSTTFGSTLDAPGTGALQLSGTVSFGGNIGSTNPLGTLTVLTGANFGASVATVNVAALNIVAPAPATFAATIANVNASNSITFGGDLNAAVNNVTTLNLNAATGSVTFGGNIGNNNIFAALNINQASTVVFATGTHTVDVNNWIVGSSTMLIPTVLQGTDSTTINSSGVITFFGTIDGSQSLNLNATSTITLDSDVGATIPLNTLAIEAGSELLFGDAVTTVTVGTLNISGTIPTVFAATMTTVTTTGSGGITFNGSLNGEADNVTTLDLSAVGPVTFGNDIGTTEMFTALNIDAASQVIFTAGTHTVDVHNWDIGTITTLIPTILQGTNATTINSGGSITFYGTIDGSQTLTLNATDTVSLNGNIGATTPLAALDIPGGNVTTFGTLTATVTATVVNIASPVTYATTGTLNITGSTTFSSTLDAPGTGNLQLSGTVSFGGNIGSTNPLGTLTVLTAANFGASVATVNVAALNLVAPAPATFAATTANVNASNSITFGGDLNAAVNNVTTLNLNAATGSVTFGGDIGNNAIFAALNINQASTVVFATGTHTVDVNNWIVGSSTMLIPTVLQGADSTTINSGGSITFYGTVDGAQSLTLNATNAVTLNSNIGATTPLAALNIPVGSQAIFGTAAGTVNASIVNIAIPAAFATSTVVTGTNGITFGSTLDGSANLTLNAASGTLSFGGNVTTIGETILNAGTASFGAAVATISVGALNVQTTTHAIFAAATTTVTATSGDLTFSGNIDGTANGVTTLNLLAPNGNVTIGDNVGTLFRLNALNINAGSTTVFTSGTHTVNVGAFNSVSPVIAEGVGSTTINTNFPSGPITFGDTINGDGGGSYTIVLNAGTGGLGTVTLNGNVGDVNPLGTLSVVSADLTTMASTVGTVSAGAISFASPVTYATTATLNMIGTNSITFGSTLDAPGTGNLALSAASGSIFFNGNVGVSNAPGNVLVSSANLTSFGAQTSIVNIGTLTIMSPTTFGASSTVTASAGGISFDGTLDASTSATLSFSALQTVSFNGNVGLTSKPAGINVTTASQVSFGTQTATVNVGALTIADAIPAQFASSGTTSVTTGGGPISFGGTVDGPASINLVAGTGTITINGDVGSLVTPNGFTVTSAALTSFTTNASSVNADAISIASPAQIAAATTTFTSNNGSLSFGSTISGLTSNAQSLTLVAGSGSIALGGAVGSSIIPLNAVTITSANNVIANAITANTLTQVAGSGISTFNGVITTTGATSLTGNQFAINNNVGASAFTIVNAGTFSMAPTITIQTTGSFNQSGGGLTQAGGTITAGGNIHFTNAITLPNSATMNATGNISYDSTIDGPASLSASATNVTYSAAVGASTALTSITTNATGVITINANQTVSSGPMTYTGDVSLTNDAIFTDNGSGAVSFSADITGAHNATITAPNTSVSVGGNIDLSGSVGGNLDISAGSGFTTAGSITTTGVSTGGSVAISSSNGSVQVNTVTTTGGTSSGNITLSASSAISGGYPVGLIVLDGNLDASPASAQGGIITLDSNRPSEPTVATIVGSSYPPGNSITIEGQSIVMGYNEAMTIYGNITLLAPSMTLSDIVALDNLTIDAGGGTIYANTRGTVTILNSSGMMVFSPTLHYLAGGSYSRTGNLVLVDPSEPAPVEERVPLLTYNLLIYNGHVLNYDPNEMPVPPTPPSPVTPTSIAVYEMYLLAIANSQLSDRLPIYWYNFPPSYYLRQKPNWDWKGRKKEKGEEKSSP